MHRTAYSACAAGCESSDGLGDTNRICSARTRSLHRSTILTQAHVRCRRQTTPHPSLERPASLDGGARVRCPVAGPRRDKHGDTVGTTSSATRLLREASIRSTPRGRTSAPDNIGQSESRCTDGSFLDAGAHCQQQRLAHITVIRYKLLSPACSVSKRLGVLEIAFT